MPGTKMRAVSGLNEAELAIERALTKWRGSHLHSDLATVKAMVVAAYIRGDISSEVRDTWNANIAHDQRRYTK